MSNELIDWAKERLGYRFDTELANAMRVTSSTFSKLRHGGAKFGPSYQLRILELTGITVSEMRKIMEGKCKETLTQ
jgi:transcriptional regulator with XRE-family HTH domain